MGIFLTILKIAGLIILVTLAIMVAFVLLVLFAPVRYKVLAEFNNDVKVSLRIRWLAGVLYYRNDYPGMEGKLRLFGIPVGRNKKQKSNKKSKNENNELQNQSDQINKEMIEPAEKIVGKEADGKQEYKQKNNVNNRNNKSKDIKPKRKRGKKQSLINKITDIFRMIRDDNNRKLISHIKAFVVNILKHVKPRKIKADLVIGLDDPAATGMLFGAIGIVRGFLNGKYNIYPDFEKKKVEGSIRAKGYIISWVVLCNILKIYNNQEFKILLKKGRAR